MLGPIGCSAEVVRLVERARAVIARAAVSEGISWELRWIRAAGQHRKLFVVLPPEPAVRPWQSLTSRYCEWIARFVFRMRDRAGSSDMSWAEFVTHMKSLEYQLPDRPFPAGSVLTFDDEARAVPIAAGAVEADEYVNPIARHLARAYPSRGD